MKKKLLIALLAILSAFACAFGIAGCSEKPSGNGDNGEGNNTQHTTHIYDRQVTESKFLKSAADCTHKAIYYYSCECGERGMETFEYGEPSGHEYVNYIYNNDATCTTDGTKTAKCEQCAQTDTIKDETHLKTGHSFTQEKAEVKYLKTLADCLHGEIYYYSCTCGLASTTEIFEYGEPNGHSFVSYIYNNDATCTTDGTKTAKCEHCTQTDTVKDEGHLKTGHSFTQEKVEAKYLKTSAECTQKAVYYKSCSICGLASTTETFEYGEPNGHSFTQEKAEVQFLKTPADCLHKAVYYYSCSCGELGTEVFEYGKPNGHKYSQDWSKDFTHHWHVCSNGCGIKGSEAVHDWHDIVTEPTCTTAGYTTHTCSICGYSYADSNVPATGHSWSTTWSKGDNYHWHECTNDGCTTIENTDKYGYATHNYLDGKCECGKIKPTEGLTYKFSDKTYYCSGIGTATETDIVIADTYNNLPVTSIGPGAFVNCSGLTSVTIPDSVTSIGSSAFYGCSGLTNITIQGNVTSIGSTAFYGCSSITSITIPNSVTSIGELAFFGCTGFTSVTIGSSVTNIGTSAFSGCNSIERINYTGDIASWCGIDGLDNLMSVGKLTRTLYIAGQEITGELVIPDGVTSIGDRAFYLCSGLTSITIPDSVTSIGNCAFSYCDSLKSITLPFVGASKDGTENAHFGYIFGASSYLSNSSNVPTSLRTVVITGGESIGERAFQKCKGLTSIAIGNGVTSIGKDAFSGCSELSSVTIGNGVTSIGSAAFSGCSNLEDIYYTGDIAGWCGISGLVYLMNYGKSDKTLYLNEQELTGELVLPYSVTTIPSYAFNGCNKITSLTISDGVASICDYAFSGCRGLTSIAISDSVTSIGYAAFYGCNSLESVILPFVGNGTDKTHCGYIFGASSSSSLKTVIVTGGTSIGDSAFSSYSSLESVIIPDSVTSIGNWAFDGCINLTSINIPDSVTSIGEQAFSGCGSLKSVTIGNSLINIDYGAFMNCNNIENIYYTGDIASWCEINGLNNLMTCGMSTKTLYVNGQELTGELVIPDSVTIIPSCAFYYCSGLTSITIPNSVTSIDSSAFFGCSGLTCVMIPDSVTSIGEVAFSGCSSLENIYYTGDIAGWCGINGLNNLMSWGKPTKTLYINEQEITGELVIPDGVTSIGDYAFYGCSSLTIVTIPDSVTNIGFQAFYGCSGLTNVIIGNGVTSISRITFMNCHSLKSVTIGKNVTNIDYGAFSGCSNIENIYYTGDIAGWCGISGLNNLMSSGKSTRTLYINGQEIKGELVIPYGVTTIPSYAFYHCSGLTNVTIYDGVTSIGDSAFRYCSGLALITIPDSVTSIGEHAFYDCSSLQYSEYDNVYYLGNNSNKYIVLVKTKATDITSCTINDNTKFIDRGAFSGCSGLTSVTIGSGVTSIGYGAFSDCSSLDKVYFNGTEEKWAKISIGSSNECLTNATIIFLKHTHKYSESVIQPTCTEGGYTIYKCELCEDEYTGNYTDKLGHSFTDLTIGTNDNAGGVVEGKYCLNCHEVTLKAVNNVGYTFTGWFEGDNLISEQLNYTYTYSATDEELPVITASWAYYTLTVNSNMSETEGGFIVNFDYNDESGNGATQFISKTNSLVYPEIPTRSGYVFRGWFEDKACTQIFDFSANVTGNITVYAGWEQMTDVDYSSRIIFNIANSYNTESGAYNTTIKEYNYYYYYFTALTSGSYTINYKNNSSASAYQIYTQICNQTQNSIIKDNSLIGSKDYYSNTFTANAGDVLYIRVQRQDYELWTPNFYCYITGGQVPIAGGVTESQHIYNQEKVTADHKVTLSAVSYVGYTFLGWYDGDILISTDSNFTFNMPKENLTYTAKYLKN